MNLTLILGFIFCLILLIVAKFNVLSSLISILDLSKQRERRTGLSNCRKCINILICNFIMFIYLPIIFCIINGVRMFQNGCDNQVIEIQDYSLKTQIGNRKQCDQSIDPCRPETQQSDERLRTGNEPINNLMYLFTEIADDRDLEEKMNARFISSISKQLFAVKATAIFFILSLISLFFAKIIHSVLKDSVEDLVEIETERQGYQGLNTEEIKLFSKAAK